jgi:hypothetical protein
LTQHHSASPSDASSAIVVPRDVWLLGSIRATVFPAVGTTPAPDTWWRAATNTDPSSRTSKPATREHTEEGPFAGAQLVLTINPLGIIQWELGTPVPEDIPTSLPTAGPFLEKTSEFLQVLDRWFPHCPPASRIACGINALLPADGHRQAYEALQPLLRTVTIDPDSSELLYRINRPRPSGVVPDLRINRLSAWSVLKVRMALNQEPTPASGPFERVIFEEYACRVSLDINTVPTFTGTFQEGALLSTLYGELYWLAVEILERGDIP